ncbi:MAG: hypothetical protein JSV89_13075 [Spirochaetaceae bacterium]|nr:MAG: hypothetical protein JSV89_13075 [Spirochaetaceae bacterium]
MTKTRKIINVGAMRFRCPSCSFSGGVRIPDHLPKGKTVRIRCSRCQKSFPLSLGRLFPQEYPAAYQALVEDSLGCRGIKVGQLWVECVGPREDRAPVIVLPAHPSLPHDVMHGLMDTFEEYFRVCYLEFPGTSRNPQPLENRSYASLLSDHIDPLKRHVGASSFHLLAHLGSAPLALDVAARRQDSITSLVLIEPDLRLGDPSSSRSTTRKLATIINEADHNGDREKLLVSMLQDLWSSKLPQPHALGLAKILATGFRPEALNHDLIQSRRSLRYAMLSRQKTPTLILHSRDGSDSSRQDSFFLQATLPAVDEDSVEKGGAWAAWFRGSAVANRLLAFKRGVDSNKGIVPRRRTQTLNGQPLGWMVLAFVVLAAGLSLGASLFRFQPDFMSRVIPALLAGLLPILWFIIPKKTNPLVFFRFRHFSVRTVLLPLAIGALVGMFYRSLLLTLGSLVLPIPLPSSILSAAPGSPGRLFELGGIGIVGLFVFGAAENLWVLRRGRLQVLMPTLLFTLLPPAFPDILWKLPMGFVAAVLFAAGTSIYSPLFLLAGFTAASELPIPIRRVPISWQNIQGVIATIVLLAAAVLLAVFLGTSGKQTPPEELYFRRSIADQVRKFRWEPSLGIVMVVFSLIVAAILIFGFVAV